MTAAFGVVASAWPVQCRTTGTDEIQASAVDARRSDRSSICCKADAIPSLLPSMPGSIHGAVAPTPWARYSFRVVGAAGSEPLAHSRFRLEGATRTGQHA